jgi:hypothetical protein
MPAALSSALQLLDPVALRARVQRRSYWSLRYTDGRVVQEWEVDWSLVPARSRQSLRLYCPNGQVAEMGNTDDAAGRLFQFKGATMTAGVGSRTDFHVIGILTGAQGQCDCAAWDYAEQRLVTFRDNVHQFAYGQVGPINPAVLGIRPD